MLYGMELVLDMSNCDVSKFNRKSIKAYFSSLCKLICVEQGDLYFWDDFRVPQEERQTNPKTKGTTAVQFILTSNITIHTLDLLKAVFVNIFSCDEYDTRLAERLTVEFFKAESYKSQVMERSLV